MKSFRKILLAFLCCCPLLSVACGKPMNADTNEDVLPRNAKAEAQDGITPAGDISDGPEPSPVLSPETVLTLSLDGQMPPATKINGELYWTMYFGGQADRFKIKEENYIGEILCQVPRSEDISAGSPDYSSNFYSVGTKVYRDDEDETALWFVEYHEEDNYNQYTRGTRQERVLKLPPKGEEVMLPATKIDGKLYWTVSFFDPEGPDKVKEENYIGEILHYMQPEGVSEDSPDYSSNFYSVGAKVYRDDEDETKLWFAEYREAEDCIEYSFAIRYAEDDEE